MGWDNVFQVEKDEFCQKVLAKNFPDTKRYGDIKEFEGKSYRGSVDILTGGFPCQPFSNAGKRKGTEDDRYLWPEMLRVIREIQPSFVVGENVRGLLNWSKGLVFEQVQTDLENEGYEITPFLLPACGLNAPHRRDRVWFIANSRNHVYSNELDSRRNPRETTAGETVDKRKRETSLGERIWIESFTGGSLAASAHSNQRRKGRMLEDGIKEAERHFSPLNSWDFRRAWEDFPTQSPVCRGDDGIPNRVDRIKGLGNAVVPQVVYQIFKAIEQTLSH
jgi:DNA (cytosine-5)-methyltransferase 1